MEIRWVSEDWGRYGNSYGCFKGGFRVGSVWMSHRSGPDVWDASCESDGTWERHFKNVDDAKEWLIRRTKEG